MTKYFVHSNESQKRFHFYHSETSQCVRATGNDLYTNCSSAHQTSLRNRYHRRRSNCLEYSGRSCTGTGRHGMLHSHNENTRAPIRLLSFATVLLRTSCRHLGFVLEI